MTLRPWISKCVLTGVWSNIYRLYRVTFTFHATSCLICYYQATLHRCQKAYWSEINIDRFIIRKYNILLSKDNIVRNAWGILNLLYQMQNLGGWRRYRWLLHGCKAVKKTEWSKATYHIRTQRCRLINKFTLYPQTFYLFFSRYIIISLCLLWSAVVSVPFSRRKSIWKKFCRKMWDGWKILLSIFSQILTKFWHIMEILYSTT